MSPLIHIGMSKCGSTWLQRNLFRAQHGFGPLLDVWKCSELFVNPRPFQWQPPAIEPLKNPHIRAVISLESLAGDITSGGRNAEVVLKRLHTSFPDARILLVIREQQSMIRSVYTSLVNWGSPYPLRSLLRDAKKHNTTHFSLETLRYHRVIQAYQSTYGKDQLLVLPYELFKSKPEEFVSRICHFADVNYPEGVDLTVQYNASRSLANLQIKRLLNRFWFNTRFNVNGVFKPTHGFGISNRGNFELRTPQALNQRMEQRFKDIVTEEVGDFFTASNRQTATLTSLDLDKFHYSM